MVGTAVCGAVDAGRAVVMSLVIRETDVRDGLYRDRTILYNSIDVEQVSTVFKY